MTGPAEVSEDGAEAGKDGSRLVSAGTDTTGAETGAVGLAGAEIAGLEAAGTETAGADAELFAMGPA